jgi:YggT family protein
VAVVFKLLEIVVLLFFICLIGRLVLDWVQALSREWRPRGPILVVAEAVYTVTDPPLRLLRKLLPPLRLGAVQLDLAFLVLAILCSILMPTFDNLSRQAALS